MVVMLALLSTGVVYAHWSETLYITGTAETGELDWEFVRESFMCKDVGTDWTTIPYTMDYAIALDKDVGSTTGVLSDGDGDGDLDTLTVTMSNVYPCYYNELSVKVHNNGTIPLHTQSAIIVWGNQEITLPTGTVLVLLDNDDKEVFEIRWMEPSGDQIHPCEQREISFELHMLQDGLQEDWTFTFAIKMIAVQWNTGG